MLRRARAGWRSRRSTGWRGCCGRTRSSGRFRVRRRVGGASARVLPRCRASGPGAGPNGSVWMREASIPIAAKPALISSMNGAGPQRYASAFRGGSSSASRDAVRRPALSKSRPSRSSGPWTAVADVGPHVWERSEQRAGLGGEGVVAAAACAVQPPDLSVGMLLRQRVEHGEDRGCPDAGADQQHGRVRLVEDEGAPWCCDLELVANRNPGVQVAAGGAVRLALDGDPVVVGAGRSREGVVAQHRSLLSVGLQSQRQVLAGARGRQPARRRGPRGGWR